jgi:hypothetical protein
MSKKHNPAAKPWVPLPEAHLFNQLNEVTDVTDQREGSTEGQYDEADLMAKGAASNIINVGFGGM